MICSESTNNTLIQPNTKDLDPSPTLKEKISTTYSFPYAPIARGFVVLTICIAPLCTHAGVFSALFGLVAEADTPDTIARIDMPQTTPLLRAVINTDPHAAQGGGDIIVDGNGFLISDLGPSGTHDTGSASDAGEIHSYTVRESDSLSEIAEMFDVSVNTILWANEIKDPNTIRPGDTLVILPVSGVRHVVKKGDTLKAIATKYNGDVADITAYNRLVEGADLVAGTTIVIPGGQVTAPPAPVKKKAAATKTPGSGSISTSGYFTRPLPSAYPKTQGIHGYNGVDIGAPVGTGVHAAAAGTVILARSGGGWNGGYGNYIVIKHANGTQTLYAHLSSVGVSVGETVTQGEIIGASGNTGQSTGPHLHFEVRGGKNPF